MVDSRPFNLLQFLSISGFFLILTIGVVIIFISQQMMVAQLVKSGENANVALANSIVNAMWDDHAGYVMSVEEADGDILRNRPETALIHQDVERLVSNIQVLKVKIYNTDAVTIYSSQESQIGESKADSPGFLNALQQQVPVSKLSRRASFNTFSGQVPNVALVETYVPIVSPQNNQVVSVFELYSDVSLLTERIKDTIVKLTYILAGLLLVLYLALFYVIREAHKTIDQQRSDLEKHQLLLESANEALQTEITGRKNVAGDFAYDSQRLEESKVLPLVVKMCKDVGKVYLAVAGADQVGELKTAYGIWRKNRILGPSSINIFINLLSKNLEGPQRIEFESRAQDCIRL